MKRLLRTMLARLDANPFSELISWASPVPCFGNLQAARVATLGLNPSNREFVDEDGRELEDSYRRFHTLGSLGLDRWSDATTGEVSLILDSCLEYFFRNPYSAWFNRLSPLVGAVGCSYYDRIFPACHIDLIPFATDAKWGSLAASTRRQILRDNADLLAQLIRESELELIILNGQSVVSEFVEIAGVSLDCEEMSDWSLPRTNGASVSGLSYSGLCGEIGGKSLRRQLRVLGFNHNIQSSFGVTTKVVRGISRWIGECGKNFEYA